MERQFLKRAFQALTGLLMGLALILWLVPTPSAVPSPSADSYFLPSPIPAPAFSLTSHRGDPVTLDSLTSPVTAVFFGYTSCPDICPLTLTHMRRVITLLGDAGDDLQVLFVTVDPERDSPERMKAYLQAFHPDFLGLTGTDDQIKAASDGFGVYAHRVGDGPAYTVDHSARTFIIDGEGRIPLSFPFSASPETMARDIARLLRDEADRKPNPNGDES